VDHYASKKTLVDRLKMLSNAEKTARQLCCGDLIVCEGCVLVDLWEQVAAECRRSTEAISSHNAKLRKFTDISQASALRGDFYKGDFSTRNVWSHITTHLVLVVVLLGVTSFQIRSGWNSAGMFFKWIHTHRVTEICSLFL